MNTAVVAKSAGGVAVVGTGSGYGGYVIYDRYTTTIKDTIENSQFLNTTKTEENKNNTDDSKWEVLVGSYWDADTKKKIKDFDLTKPESGDVSTDDKDKIKEKCKELLDRAIGFEDLTLIKQQVKDWCTEIQNLKEALNREGKSVLEGEDDFKGIIESKSSDTELVQFVTGGTTPPLSADKKGEYKKKCEELFTKTPKDTDYSTNLDSARKHCVKKDK